MKLYFKTKEGKESFIDINIFSMCQLLLVGQILTYISTVILTYLLLLLIGLLT